MLSRDDIEEDSDLEIFDSLDRPAASSRLNTYVQLVRDMAHFPTDKTEDFSLAKSYVAK